MKLPIQLAKAHIKRRLAMALRTLRKRSASRGGLLRIFEG